MAQMTVGIRQLKGRLSYFVDQVKTGATVVITERGKPVGQIVPVPQSLEARLHQLVEAGLISWSGRRLRTEAPQAAARGSRTVAELLLEDRE